MRRLNIGRLHSGVVLLAFVFIIGCGGSIRRAGMQDVSITTDPPGVKATINDLSCITPCILNNVDRTADYIMFEQGAFRQQYVLEKKYNPGATVKVFPWWDMGVSALWITGAAYEIQPVDVRLSGFAGALISSPALTSNPPAPSETAQATPGMVAGPMAVGIGVSNNFFAYDAHLLTGFVSLEKMLSTHWSTYLNIGYVDYGSKQDDYRDTAHGMGVELGVRIYAHVRELEGPYLGGGVGYWGLRGGWKDDVGTPFVTAGSGEAVFLDGNVHAGYKWSPAAFQSFFIDPSVAVGFMSSRSEPEPFGPTAVYLNTKLAIGMRW